MSSRSSTSLVLRSLQGRLTVSPSYHNHCRTLIRELQKIHISDFQPKALYACVMQRERRCHGSSEASGRKKLGLRIISSKSEAVDAFKQQIAKERPRDSSGSSSRDFKYSVLRINNDGTWKAVVLNAYELNMEGVQAKDLDLLAGNFFIPKRSAIAVRKNQILIRMENVRALIFKNHCLLFDAHRPRKLLANDGSGGKGTPASEQAREAFASLMGENAKRLMQNPQDETPFHLCMIECLLDETCNFFHQKVQRLKLVAEKLLEELTKDVDTGGFQRLLPLKRALTEVEHDVRDTHEAMDQILGNDDMLDALCLKDDEVCISEDESQRSSKRKEHHGNEIRQAAADIIVSCQRKIDDAGGALEEMRKGMDSAQEVWELGLDTTRNRIITMNLYISIVTVTFNFATVPASFFGMNLLSGIEIHPHMFYWVVGTTTTIAFVWFFGLLFAFRVLPTFKDKRRAQDLAALRDLLLHMDTIDDLFQSVAVRGEGSRLTQKKFEEVLKAHSSTQYVRKRELELMFRMFDDNRNGMLELAEWNASGNEVKQKE